MRVLHCTWGYPSLVEPFEATYFYNQVDGLMRVGLGGLSVVAPLTWIPSSFGWFSTYAQRRRQIPKFYCWEGIEVYRPRYVRSPGLAGFRVEHLHTRMVLRACFRQWKPDLVHAHGGNSLGLAALEAAEALGIPSVLSLHGSDVYRTALESERHRALFKRAVGAAGACLGISEDLAQQARDLSGREVLHVPIGINLERFASRVNKTEARRHFKLPVERPIVLFLGNLFETKGVRVLLEALGKGGAGELGVFAGEGPLSALVEANPHALGLGPVDYADIPKLIAAADLLALPSFSEGLGTVLVEAGAVGTPVVGTAVGGIPGLLGEERGYLVPARDAQALAQTIAQVLGNPSEALHRAKRLQDYVRSHYEVGRNSRRLLEVYQNVLMPGESPMPASNYSLWEKKGAA